LFGVNLAKIFKKQTVAGLYSHPVDWCDDCINSAALDPVWKIAAERRLSLFRAYVDKRRFIPEEYLCASKVTVNRPGLRSAIEKPDYNSQRYDKPICSQRQQCETTALSQMINQWNNLSNSIAKLTWTNFKKLTKNGEITKHLINAKVLNPLVVPVRNPTWSMKRK
jgi:hypothetical protein